MDSTILAKAKLWLEGNFDAETKAKVQSLITENPNELLDSFYCNLEFGTGGLRGIMGVGTNRMNKYTVGMATQGLCNYLKKMFTVTSTIKIAIAYDSRNNSNYFAQISADVFSANGIYVYLYDALRPTPLLSFTIRELGCQSGIVITASHNPKEYNGYKVYWEDGGQLINPHDKNVITEVVKIQSIDDVKWNRNEKLVELIGEKIDKIYLDKIAALSLSPDAIARQKNLKIVYTPLHGSGVRLVPTCLKQFGFENITTIAEQMISDGNFPTIKSPNPEEGSALEMATKKAAEIDADLVLATDPDADRVGIAIKDNTGRFILLNGNQTGSLLIYYIITRMKELGRLTGNEYIVKTVVTSQLFADIAEKNKVACFNVLTGFKYIADIIKQNEGKKKFIGGGEESYGYLAADFVRDKDAVMSCALIAEMTAYAKDKGLSLFESLIDIYREYGFYKESLLSLTKKGISGVEEINNMMINYRANPPKTINNSDVVRIADYQLQKEFDLKSAVEKNILLPKSNVLQFFLADGSIITVRPSGTEPKIKFYFGVKGILNSKSDYDKVNILLNNQIQKIIESLQLK